MKITVKVLLLIIFITGISNANLKAQTYFQIGYNAGFPNGLDNLNYVINRYNETRSYLTIPMEKINFLDGFTVTMGGNFGVIFVDLGYTAGIQRRFAEGEISNVLTRRELKVSTHVFDIDMGLCLINKKFGVFLGGSMNIGGFSVKTRVAESTAINSEDWTKINLDGDLYFTLGLFLKFCFPNPGFYIQPYYHFPLNSIFSNDMSDVNEALNPFTYENDPSPLDVNNGTFGVKIGFSIIFDNE